jgi:hypothetical protein
MSIIDDFADIAKRMKGELAPKPKVEEVIEVCEIPQAYWRSLNAPSIPFSRICGNCLGIGCTQCNAKGVIDP